MDWIKEYIKSQASDMMQIWQQLVDIDSHGSSYKSAILTAINTIICNHVSVLPTQRLLTQMVPDGKDPTIIYTFNAESTKEPIVFLGHVDTVLDNQYFFAHDDVTVLGSGALDMKGGLVIMLFTVFALLKHGYSRPIKVVLTTDEESGHTDQPFFAELLIDELRGAKAAFSFETASPDRNIIVSRSGTINFDLSIIGKATHVGRNPENGINAILLVQKVLDYVMSKNDIDPDNRFIVTPTMIEGGIARNVTPDKVVIKFDVRCSTPNAYKKALEHLNTVQTELGVNQDIDVAVSIRAGIPPMPLLHASVELFAFMKYHANKYGIDVGNTVHSGGAGDAAYAALAGVPVIDQMGVEGEHNHTPKEYATIESLYRKTELAIVTMLALEECQDDRYSPYTWVSSANREPTT